MSPDLEILLAAPVTGAQLVEAIEIEARRRGVTARTFAAPLASDAGKALHQLSIARRPKPPTIARVRALLAGEEVPPPPPNNFQKFAMAKAVAYRPGAAVRPDRPLPGLALPKLAERFACPWCGVRSDIGCRHLQAHAQRSACA